MAATNTTASFEETFEKLKKEGKNDVDGLVQWMKDAKILGTESDSEAKVRKLFEGCSDQKNVELVKFKEVVTETCKDSGKGLEDVLKTMATTGQNLMAALQAGAAAVQAGAATVHF